MIRFLYPSILWLLALLPLLALLRGRRGPVAAVKFPNADIARQVARETRSRAGKWLALLKLVALALIIIALARPQFGRSTSSVEASGVDMILAMDCSGSMEALDFKLDGRPANRLDVVKSVVSKFIDARRNDRIGLVGFAVAPYLVSPLTLDHDWLQQNLDRVQIGTVEHGTAIGAALATSVNRLREQPSKWKIVVQLTDGQNNAGKVMPETAAQAAKALGVKAYTIGAGVRGEAPAPITDAFGNKRLAMAKVDVDEDTLKKIADETGGKFFRRTDTASLESSYTEIDRLEKTTHQLKKFEHHSELFAFALLPALAIFGDDSPFNEPFFDNFFGGMTEKPLTLHTDGAVVKIKALPTAGRPADFSGTVGKFDVTSEVSARTGATDDPLTLKMNITGTGNFDRVTTNGLPASAGWKSYKPNARFEPAERSNTSGTKTFEQSIVPAKAGAQEIPAVSFSYFDPEAGTYVMKKTDAIAVEIAQSAAPSAQGTVRTTVAAKEATTTADGLAADQAASGRATGSLQPLVLRPWFIAVNAAMVAALAIGCIIRGIRARRANDPKRLERLARKKAVNDWLAAMDEALDKEDAPQFFQSARRALQERMAEEWQVPANRVTIPEIRSRLNGEGEEIRAVFQTADEMAYSRKPISAPELRRWHDIVKSKLHHFALL